MFRVVCCALIVLCCCVAHAYEERTFDTPEDQDLYESLIAELRCLVCQNQNIADSNAELAVDLRREVYKMIKDDKTESDILDFMVQRYGEFVLYKPRFALRTIALWLGPVVLLIMGGLFVWRSSFSSRNAAANAPDAAALSRARSLLDDD